MTGDWILLSNGFARPTVNRRANLQSPLKRTGAAESPSGGFVRIALGFSPGRGRGEKKC